MQQSRELNILWTNADPLTAQHMVMMYATNSKIHHWWDEVTVIIWGAAALTAAENASVQEHIRVAQNVGVRFSACVACARQLGVVEALEALHIEVKPWGELLTELIREGKHLLTV